MSRRAERNEREGKEDEGNDWNNSLSENEELNGENLIAQLERENAEVAAEKEGHARTRAEKAAINAEIEREYARTRAEKAAITAQIARENREVEEEKRASKRAHIRATAIAAEEARKTRKGNKKGGRRKRKQRRTVKHRRA
jgi:hypothetical protein